MAANPQTAIQTDLDALREEYQQLSKTAGRLNLLRLLFLLLFAVGLSSAFEKIHFQDNQKISNAKADLMVDVDAIVGANSHRDFDPTPFLAGSCPAPEKYVRKLVYDWSPGDTARLDAKKQEVSSSINNLCTIYERAFLFPVDVLGAKPELDLRHWVFSLPFLYWFSIIYMQLFDRKLRLLRILGGHSLASLPEGQASVLDHLLFSGSPPKKSLYARLPWQFVKPFYLLSTLGIFAYLAAVWKPFWISLEPGDLIGAGQLLLICVLAHFVYLRRVSSRLQSEVLEKLGVAESKPPRSGLRAFLHRTALAWKNRIPWERSLRFSRTYLFSGAALTLLTLFLATTSDGCSSFTGYQLAAGSAPWVGVAPLLSASWAHATTLVGRDVYLGALGLAVVTLLFLALALLRPARLRSRWLLALLLVASVVVSSFVLAQIAFLTLPYDLSMSLQVVWFAFWVAQVIVWSRFALSTISSGPPRWPSRGTLILLYVPLIPALLWCPLLIADVGIPGLACYLAGVHLMTIGYLQLCHLSSKVQAPSPP